MTNTKRIYIWVNHGDGTGWLPHESYPDTLVGHYEVEQEVAALREQGLRTKIGPAWEDD